MGLNAALSIATSGLNATQYALSVASQNISNASTAGYSAEVANVSSVSGGGVGGGVAIGPTSRVQNAALTNALTAQNAEVAGWSATSSVLSTITSVQGSTTADAGNSGTLSDQLGNVQTALISLSGTPSSSAARSTVVANAQSLCAGIQTLGNAYQGGRQSAQDAIVSSVGMVNTDLTTIGSISTQIMAVRSSGGSTADLENQRATAVANLSSQLSVKTSESATGDLVVRTAGGTILPTHPPDGDNRISATWPLTTQNATVTAGSVYPSATASDALPGILLNGSDVTLAMTGGALGANITLRDSTLPRMQAQLDSFSSALSSRFAAQGMPLFTPTGDALPGSDPTTVAPGGTIGLSQTLSVNSAYVNDPSLLVNGSQNSTQTVQNVLNYGFGTTLADGASQPDAPSSGLGANGGFSTGYDGGQGLLSLATSLTADQANTANTASSALTTAQTTQASLSTKVSDATGVSVDNEMSNVVALQNAYSANAKVVSAVQSMFSSLLNAIGG